MPPGAPKKRNTEVGKKKKSAAATAAYAPAAKTAFRKKRQPFVETKKREHTIIAYKNVQAGIDAGLHPLYATQPMNWLDIPNDDAYTHFNLASFYRLKQGLGEDEIVGDTIYARYLKCKVEIRFPDNMNLILKPNKIYMVQGWVTNPMDTNASRGIFGGTGTDSLTSTASDVLKHVSNSVKQYFNESEDRLRFMPRGDPDIKILRKDLLVPDMSQTALGPSLRGEAGFIGTNGTIPDVHRSYTWKINRKISLTQGTGADGKTKPQDNSADSDVQNMFNNDSWVPFLIMYSPQFDVYKEGETATGTEVHIQTRYNDCLWFGDS